MLKHLNVMPTEPKRVVVIGTNGFVGSSISRELKNNGINTFGVDRTMVDLLDTSASARLKSYLADGDSVVFVSAIAPAKNTVQFFDNIKMAKNSIDALSEFHLSHFVYLSSDAVYADDANPVIEESPLAPTTLHGMMHAARELMFRTEIDAPFATLRPTLIYGARDPHSGYGPNRFRRQAVSNGEIPLFGEGEEKRDHVAVEDVARLIARIVVNRSTGALNAATGHAVSFYDIATLVAENFKSNVSVVKQPRTGPRPHLLHRFFNITGCYRAFPDFQFESLADGLKRVHLELGL